MSRQLRFLTCDALPCERSDGMSSQFGGRLVFATLVVGLTFASASVGCGHSSPDNAPKVDDQGPPLSPMPWAANANEVSRYADEEPFGPSATVSQDKTKVRKIPGSGDLVSTLPAGTEVTKLAAHGTDDLICFDEPQGGRHLMGWVPQSSLSDSAPPAPPPSAEPAQDAGPPEPPEPPTPHHHHGRKKGRHP